MGRAVLVLVLLSVGSASAFAQGSSTLRITVTLRDSTGAATPVARHALLLSEEPPISEPRRVVTTLAGTAEVTLLPGRYVVESDRPVSFAGRSYEWSRRLEIVAGRDATLELTADNASVGAPTDTATSATPSDTDPSFLAAQWQETVVGVWTPVRHASGFVVDPRGLIVTSQRIVGTATSVAAQMADGTRVRAAVLAADPDRDVAILLVNPSVVTSVRPLPLGCGEPRAALASGQALYALGADTAGQRHLTLGEATVLGPRLVLADLRLRRASAGGPVFAAGGVMGFTTIDDRDPEADADTRVIRIDQACEVTTSAAAKLAAAMPPEATPLPRDPPPVAETALAEAVKSRAGSLNPYAMRTSGFDITFITPVHRYGARDRERRPETDFGNWSDYLAGYPRALLVRVTPRLVEGLWARVARGAAMTQGVALPPMKRAKSGFLRLRVSCGAADVTPIHPFVIEHRVSPAEAIFEGLYMFDPAAFASSCGTVTLTVYSEDEPDQGDARPLERNVLELIARDFAQL